MTTPGHRTESNRQPTVRFALTYEDYWAFNQYAFLRTPWLPLYFAGLFAVVLALMTENALRDSDPVMAFLRNFLLSSVLIAFVGGAVWFRYRNQARRVFAANPQIAGRTTVRLDDRGVRVQAEAGTLEVDWDKFRRVVQTRDSIYLFYGLGLATIIPKRAFANEAAAQAFFRFARDAWGRATAAG